MKNLYLIGMMGSGKSHWGKTLALDLGRPFLDLDEYLTQKTGLSPAQWLEQGPEPAFRQQEWAALCEVASLRWTVIATGGGTPLSRQARTLMTRTGDILWLDAPEDTLWARSQENGSRRPLARDEVSFKSLYQERRPLYAEMGRRVDTHRPPEEVFNDLRNGQSTLPHAPSAPKLTAPAASGDYPVKQVSSVEHAGLWIRERLCPPFMIVAPALVFSLYGHALVSALGTDEALHCIIPDGEEHKTLGTVERLYHRFLEASLHRSSTVIALGGGVTGDMVGFAAATYLRGLPLVQLPTTLLAQVDSSVGGKVGVNLEAGKNLVGSFYAPRASLQVTSTLHSLPDEVYRQGLAEIVKCALLKGEEHLSWLEANALALSQREPNVLHGAIYAANKLKANIVRSDEYDTGSRHVLNLGHTLAHALETSLGYGNIGHGDAVAYGLQWALCLSPARHLYPRVRKLLLDLGFPPHWPQGDANEILSHLAQDKKRSSQGLTLVLLNDPGMPRLETGITFETMKRAWNEAALAANELD